MYRKDRRSAQRGGGVVIFVSNSLKNIRRDDLELDDIEAPWVEVKFSKTNLLICNVYRPPNALATWMDTFGNLLEAAATGSHKRLVWVTLTATLANYIPLQAGIFAV